MAEYIVVTSRYHHEDGFRVVQRVAFDDYDAAVHAAVMGGDGRTITTVELDGEQIWHSRGPREPSPRRGRGTEP
jgi:hypothetical protein